MDPARYKHPRPELLPWPGSGQRVGLRPLTIGELQTAEAVVQSWSKQHLVASLIARVQVLALSLCEPLPPHSPLFAPPELAERLTSEVAGWLYARWERVQRDHVPDTLELERALVRSLPDSGLLAVEGALTPDGLCAFYGLPLAALTLGQVSYFLALRSAYDRLYGHTGAGTRAISRRMLEERSSPREEQV